MFKGRERLEPMCPLHHYACVVYTMICVPLEMPLLVLVFTWDAGLLASGNILSFYLWSRCNSQISFSSP